jgi:hypothetical protein
VVRQFDGSTVLPVEEPTVRRVYGSTGLSAGLRFDGSTVYPHLWEYGSGFYVVQAVSLI